MRELHPLLQTDVLSLGTLKAHALNQLADEANRISELMRLVRDLKSVRPPEPYTDGYSLDRWYRLIGRCEYEAARQFLIARSGP